jgi:hypothetical protein
VDRAARCSAIQPRDELLVLVRDAGVIALDDGGVQAPRERLRGRAEPEILEPLLSRGPDALLLLLDVGHSRKSPQRRGRQRS